MRIKNTISSVVSVLALVGLSACSSASSVAVDKAASEQRRVLASSFSRELLSLAAQTQDASDNAAPQDPTLLLMLIEGGDIPTGVSVTTNGAASGPVMVFDGTSQIATAAQLASTLTLIEFGVDDTPVCLVIPEKVSDEVVISDGPCLF